LDATKVVLHSAHLETNTFNYTYIEHWQVRISYIDHLKFYYTPIGN
jgi:hypothetical protein